MRSKVQIKPVVHFLFMFLIISFLPVNIIFIFAIDNSQGTSSSASDSVTEESDLINQEGILFLESGNNDEAERCFRIVIEKHPSFAPGYNNLAASLMRQRRYKEACPYLEKAVYIDSRYAKAMSNLAISLFYCGEYLQAYNWYCEAKKNNGEYVKKRFYIDKLLDALNREKKEKPANTEYGRMIDYLKRNPDILN